MGEIVIVVPEIDVEQNVEIEVRISNHRKTLHYRVELLNWEGAKAGEGERFTVLKHYIDDYDKNRELVEIGAPGDNNVPLVLQKRSEATSSAQK